MSDGSIAIIGASCRFPGAPGLEAFWELLISGTDAISEVDAGRWSTRFFYHPTRGEAAKSYTWAAGLIADADQFEPVFFGLSPREAAQMDPQQRVLLELVWHAVEDAGIPAASLAGGTTGVYIGASSTDYRDLRLGDPASGDSYFMTGGTLSILANRISHAFDLRGPSLTIDTACSSSLVALHYACQAMRDGHIASAIVGGINLLLAPYPYLGFCRAAMLSRRGRCFAFDERADGYVRGEGGGAVILKPLRQALADNDRIRAVILGTGVNSDGRTIGLSLPSEAAQAELIRTVYAQAGVKPDDLAFFEMHGTGTPAGDPIEAAAVGHALGQARREALPIGSVKSNIGHLEPASGMAGLLKAALALQRGVVPPTLHCERPNPEIAFDTLNLRLVRGLEPIAGKYAGVNSFGFGGTNGHAVLAPPPVRPETQPQLSRRPPPLIVSAQSEASLLALARCWRDVLAAAPDAVAPGLLRAAARRRDQHPQRLVALGEDKAEIVAALADFVAGAETPAIVTGTAVRDATVAFVFAGNGAQWPGMGRAALRASPAFRDAIGEADDALRGGLGWSVGELIERGVEIPQLAHADIAQPLLFAIQVGIVRVLRELGVEAAGHVGHSVGEIAAAWGAGALSLTDAARVVVARSRQQERTRGNGRMAALALDAAAARELLAEIGSPLEVGAINATQAVTLSGPSAAIDQLEGEARRRGLAFRALDLEFAFHSAAMDPIRDDLLGDLAGLSSVAPQALLVSTVTGETVPAGGLDAEYWWRNIRQPVRFTDAIAALVAAGCGIFVEIGPNPVLQAYLHDGLRAAQVQGQVLATLARKQGGEDPFAAIAGRCHVAGANITGAARFDGASAPDGLPLYPWQKQRFWFERTVENAQLVDPPCDHALLGFRQSGPEEAWLNHLDTEILPWLADHAIEGVPVFPAAAVVEMALATARVRRPQASAVEVADVELRRPLTFDKGRRREMRVIAGGEDGDWELKSRPRLADEPLTQHAVARLVAAGEGQALRRPIEAGAVIGQVDAAALYGLAARLGLDYGPCFRTVRRIELLDDGAALAYLDPSVIAGDRDEYLIHPASLDGALQSLLALIADRQLLPAGISFLPWRFGRVRVEAPFGRPVCRARLRLTRVGARSASADIALFDAAGDCVGELSECWFRRVELSQRGLPENHALRIELVPAPLTEVASPAVFGRIGDILAGLLDRPADAAARRNEQALLLDALIAVVARETALRVADPDVPFTIEELLAVGAIAPDAAGLFAGLLRLLAGFGAAAEAAGVWRIAPESDLPEIGEIWRLLLAEAPELVAELALVAAAVEDVPNVLADGLRKGGPPLPIVEHLLYGSPSGAAGIDVVCAMLDAVAAAWPAERPLRLLEIGADDATTSRLVERLAQSGVAFAYRATSPEPERAARLGAMLSGVAGAGASCWSPRDMPDGLAAGSFDVIVSVAALTLLPIDDAGLERLRELLAPGGLFLAVEPAPNALWELVFGQYDGWRRHAGDRDPQSPLRSAEEWRSELVIAGFARPDAAALAAAGAWPGTVVWGRAQPASDAVATPMARRYSISLIAIGASRHAGFGEQLTRAGHAVGELDAAAFVMAAGEGSGDDGPDDRVAICLVDEDDDPVAEAARLIALVARVADAAARRHIPLWVVTGGAQQAAAGGEAGLIGAALWGFGRVLINEMPRLVLRLIDLPPAMDWTERAARIAAELAAAPTADSEIVWTMAGRHVLRLRRFLPPRWAAAADSLALGSAPRGGLDALEWQSAPPRPPGPGEVAIEVAAAGLNFRDMMWAMGLLPEEALIDGFAGATFGLECAGTVSAVGPDVDELRVGDRVAGFAPAALATRVTTAALAVTRIPDEIGFAAAATIPVTFVTAAYALGTLARLMPGEWVLIHAAAGGVGLAAIQYAKHRGAVVIATAGSAVKRAFLRLAGADHVLDSRDLGFADAVRALSGGAGVDVVLNSLSGEAMEQSLGVLKPFGRFLELGKRDFYLNRRIHLRPLRQNISYFGIDVDQLPRQRPDIARAVLGEIAAALRDGALRPLAHRVFPFAAIGDAFRLMQASGHIGKLVLMPSGHAGIRLRHAAGVDLHRDGTYLVTGGLSGFGFAAARWLAEHGARSIALLGRRGAATPGAAGHVAELRALGAEVCVYAGNVADPASLAAVLGAIRRTQPPLRGVVHAASAIGDALAVDLAAADIAGILRPKLGGALALDRLTRDDPIDLFVLFSSATTVLGAPGQGAYVAANLALEALARRRQSAGLPALAVAWGPIEDAGYLAERPETREALARRLGARPMPAAHALAGLPAMLASGLPTVGLAETSWSEARRFLPILATSLFAGIAADAGAAPGDDSLLDRLAAADAEAAVALLKTAVAEEVANILRLPAGAIDPARPLAEIGMDSLMAVELRLALESRLRVDLPLMSLAEGTSVASIASRLAGAIAARPQASELVSLAERYEGASEERLAAVAGAAGHFEPDELKSAAAE